MVMTASDFADVMNEGWLEDRLVLLCNLYTTLMQGEVDRFQDTVCMLKDYYKGMEGKIPDESSAEYARIPLIGVTNKFHLRLCLRPRSHRMRKQIYTQICVQSL